MIQRKMMTFLWFIGFFGLGISTIYSESTSQPVSKEKGFKDNSAWIPKPLQKGWDATQKKWKQTMDVYQSLKKLLGEDPKDQKKRIRKEEKEKKKERRKMEDLDIEKKVQSEFQISFYKKACQRGSAIACQRELAREPNQLQPQRILKSIYLQRQQYPKALALCKKIEQSGQATIEDILCLADASFYLGKYSQSLRSYYQIIRKNPNVGTVWLSIGKVLLQQNK